MYPLILSSIAIGFTMGLLGVGGGVLLLPVLIANGFTLQEAVATSLLMQVIPNSLPGVVMYSREGHMPWKKSLLVIALSVVGIAAGSYLGAKQMIPQVYLYRILTLMIFAAGFYFLIYFWNGQP